MTSITLTNERERKLLMYYVPYIRNHKCIRYDQLLSGHISAPRELRKKEVFAAFMDVHFKRTAPEELAWELKDNEKNNKHNWKLEASQQFAYSTPPHLSVNELTGTMSWFTVYRRMQGDDWNIAYALPDTCSIQDVHGLLTHIGLMTGVGINKHIVKRSYALLTWLKDRRGEIVKYVFQCDAQYVFFFGVNHSYTAPLLNILFDAMSIGYVPSSRELFFHLPSVSLFHSTMCPFIDLQLLYEYFHTGSMDSSSMDLMLWLQKLQPENKALKEAIRVFVGTQKADWSQQSKTNSLLNSACIISSALTLTIDAVLSDKNLSSPRVKEILQHSTEVRIAELPLYRNAQERQIRFIFDRDCAIVSAELSDLCEDDESATTTERSVVLLTSSELQSYCQVESLLALIPRTLLGEEYLNRREVMVERFKEQALEFVLDIGQRPYWKRLDNSWEYLWAEDVNVIVTSEDLEHITKQLQFGSDNRAGIDGDLHRISAMRHKDGERILGLTLRVGRHLTGNAYFLSDLLYASRYAKCSILILGPPGAGKTTLVREMARSLSQQQSVIVIDTSNEIAGDGDRPHRCIGRARRMMVPDLSQQHRVMLECVKNHTPEVVVIDEMGMRAEVIAARSIKPRGVRLIASAHGNLRSLLKNPELQDLLGGLQTSAISDREAKARSDRMDKLLTERKAAPTFEIVVELDKDCPDECRVVLDVAAAVDCVLKRGSIRAQRRCRRSTANSTIGYDKVAMDQRVFIENIEI